MHGMKNIKNILIKFCISAFIFDGEIIPRMG
jgi:hypothetical protein